MPDDPQTTPAPSPNVPTVGTPPERTFTQAELERIISERLQRDRAQRPSEDEVNQLRQRAQRADELERQSQTETQRLEAERDEARRQAALLAPQNARLQVALERGLAGERAWLADRLVGNTIDELRADADQMLARLFPPAPAGSPAATQPTVDPANPAQDPTNPTPAPPAAPAGPSPQPVPVQPVPVPASPSPVGAAPAAPQDEDALIRGYMAEHFPQFMTTKNGGS